MKPKLLKYFYFSEWHDETENFTKKIYAKRLQQNSYKINPNLPHLFKLSKTILILFQFFFLFFRLKQNRQEIGFVKNKNGSTTNFYQRSTNWFQLFSNTLLDDTLLDDTLLDDTLLVDSLLDDTNTLPLSAPFRRLCRCLFLTTFWGLRCNEELAMGCCRIWGCRVFPHPTSRGEIIGWVGHVSLFT